LSWPLHGNVGEIVRTKNTIFETTVILGIPVDNPGTDQAVDLVFFMAEDYEKDGRPRLALLLNTNTLTALHAHKKKLSDKNKEIINVFRQSDLMIPVGRLIAVAARIVGTRLKPTLGEALWLSKFLILADRKEKKLFLAGTNSGAISEAAEQLRTSFPGIGVASSDIYETKADLSDPLLEQINKTAPDFLLIDMQDSEAAGWLASNRHRIYVPVALGINGTRPLTAATGRKKTKILSKPFMAGSGSWKQLITTPLAFGFTILPLAIYQQYRHIARRISHQRQALSSVKTSLSRSDQGTILKIIALPDPLDASVVGEIKDEIKQMIRQGPKIVIDLSNVYFMDSSGLGLLLALWRIAGAGNRKIFLVGIQPPIYRFFKLSRTLDFFENSMLPNIDEVTALLSSRSGQSLFHYLAVIGENAVIFHLYGELDAPRAAEADLETIFETLGERNVILNLSGLNFIDSGGINLFIQIQRHTARNGRRCILCGIKPAVGQMLEILKIDSLFEITGDVAEAQKLLLERSFNV
jgi:anti-sigma B factor antagonist